jgi:hypothetical protein
MKNQIKFPLTLDNYLPHSLGKQNKFFSQTSSSLLADKAPVGFSDLSAPVSGTPSNRRKKANPRLRIL